MGAEVATEEKVDKRDRGGRQRLMDAALKLFAEKGIDAVRAREVAAEAGVSHGLIRHHFGSLAGLRCAVDEWMGSRFLDALNGVSVGNPGDFIAEVTAFAEAMLDDSVAAERRWAFIRRSLMESSEASEVLFDAIATYYDELVDRLSDSGGVREGLDVTWHALLHLCVDVGSVLLAPHIQRRYGRRLADKETMRERNGFLNDVFENGILKR